MVYQGQRHGTKPGIAVNFEGHTGPITAVRAHRAGGGQVRQPLQTLERGCPLLEITLKGDY